MFARKVRKFTPQGGTPRNKRKASVTLPIRSVPIFPLIVSSFFFLLMFVINFASLQPVNFKYFSNTYI